MSDKAVITCALNGVLTDPKQHNVPVTPGAGAVVDAGAPAPAGRVRVPRTGYAPLRSEQGDGATRRCC